MMDRNERLHALDAVRAGALLLGIVLHSTMSFMPGLAASGSSRAKLLAPPSVLSAVRDRASQSRLVRISSARFSASWDNADARRTAIDSHGII